MKLLIIAFALLSVAQAQNVKRDIPYATELARKTKELQTLRAELIPRLVVCGDVATGLMQERSIKPFGSGKGKKADLKGL